MKKQEIFNRLGTRITSPGRMDFILTKRVLFIALKAKDICENMQTNNSAFESWMLCIKTQLDKEIDRVMLNWESCETKEGHYNRFMYRVMKSCDYFEWFSVDKSKEKELAAFKILFETSHFILNYPESNAKETVVDKSEAYFERKLLDSGSLYKNVEFDCKDQQLPVGVFIEKKSKDSAFLTRGHSAIDLWGIKGDEFWIFELKYKNKMVGLVTELLFYMWLCEDMVKHKFRYDINGKVPSIRSFDKLYVFIKGDKARKIIGVMLYDEVHPLIDENLIDFLNLQFRNKPLEIKAQRYSTEITLL